VEFLERPNPLNVGQFNVENAGIRQAVNQQRFGFFQAGAVDDPVQLRIDSGSYRISKIRVLGQD